MVKTTEAERLLEAAPEDTGMSSAGLQRISRFVQRYVDAGRIPGAISAVVRHGKVVHFETYGNMDDEAGKGMQPDAIFRIHSMTKPIASVGLMLLHEEGLFLLDDPASRYIPQFKDLRVMVRGGTADAYETREPEREMTVRDLLMHTSGIVSAPGGSTPHLSPVPELYRRAQLGFVEGNTLQRTIDVLGELPLKCDPGSEWNYGISTNVVGYLIELLSGQRLDDFIRDRILDPLGMVDSGFMVPASEAHRFCANYRLVEGERYELSDTPAHSAYLKEPSYLSGAGGMVSTAADYLRFVKMLANGGELDGECIIGRRTLELMAMNHLPHGRDLASMNLLGEPSLSAREGVGFGLGFAVLLDPARAQTTGTPGEYYWSGAASTAFFVSPADDLAMVFLTQLIAPTSFIRRELRNIVYGAMRG
jgi:CubicO group peptidase (beta-lactamase class C family)